MVGGNNLFYYWNIKKRCEKNGGTYIWEMSYGNKCHLESKGE